MAQQIKKILIVEDDLSLRPLWEVMFRNQPFYPQLEWAVSCEEALKMIRESNLTLEPYHLIITDLFLAGSGTGMELINSKDVIKSGAKKVLVSVSDKDEIQKAFGHLLPETEIISKPLDAKKCENFISSLMRG